ncbi:MFS transporter, ACS family, hexuronate transporter [Sphingobium sp. AP50]|uniref:MFS transporter n=1 Tax=Sphingobium sp. AP50 TaxID=1884369 RepID=UPI0008B8D79C|nr:MFS transporter [Sphingobium sp. AP50]SEK00488.1 MFS transporter, ACS family, hexuronate transporter [Sphingobium sp. AP50]
MHAMSQAEAVTPRYRWVICGLLFLATGINYIDRQMIGLLKPTLQVEFGWNETAYADIVFWFQAAYALGYLVFGRIIDRLGAKLGYACAFTIWTIAHICHGFAHSIGTFALARFVLGIGESGNFPAGIKSVAEWFPPKERALATGIFNAGSNVGAIATPLLVPAITLAFGWRAAFIVTGVASFLWLIAWLHFYRLPANTKSMQQAQATPDQSWLNVLKRRETWAFAVGKFITDPIWWLFLFWLPDFLHRRHGLELKEFGPPLVVIYLVADFGSVAGGWLSSRMMQRGHSVNRARKLTMLISALAVIPVMAAPGVSSLWGAVGLIALAAAAHQAWSANLFTLPSDMLPQNAIGSAIGIGGAAGAVGGMVMTQFTGYILDHSGSYWPIFLVAGSVYLLALALIHGLVPKIGDSMEAVA